MIVAVDVDQVVNVVWSDIRCLINKMLLLQEVELLRLLLEQVFIPLIWLESGLIMDLWHLVVH